VEPQDIKAFVLVGAIGAICGALVVLAVARTKHPYVWTLTASPLAAAIGCGVFFGIAGAIQSFTQDNLPLGSILWNGLIAFGILGPLFGVSAGGVAVLAGLLLQWVVQNVLRRPPRLPKATR
jgi:MFS family permease